MENRRQTIENQRANDERIWLFGLVRYEWAWKYLKNNENAQKVEKKTKIDISKRKEKSNEKKVGKIENYKTQTAIILE